MQVFYVLLSWVGLSLTWIYVARYFTNKGKGKIVSHVIGALGGFFVMSIIIATTVDTTIQPSKESQTVSTPPISSKAYLTSHDLSDAMIMSESSDILSASVNQQYAGSTFEAGMKYNIDVNIKSSVLWGGAQDWNGVAIRIFDLSKTLFKRSDIGKISFVVWNDDHTLDWARIEVDRTQLPNKWDELTYLQFFSYTKPMSGSVDAEEWLTEFYAKYNSAIPK